VRSKKSRRRMGRRRNELCVRLEPHRAVGTVQCVRFFRRFTFPDRSGRRLSWKDEASLCAQYKSTCRDVVTEHWESVDVCGYNGLEVSDIASVAIPIV
jgi:hypothetical protein